MDNPREVLNFINTMTASARRNNILFVDLSMVRRISPDAVLLLISTLKGKRLKKCLGVHGNEPEDPKVQAAFQQSGFYSFVSQKPKGLKQREEHGVLRKHEGKRVREDVCSDLVRHATKLVYGKPRKNGGLYRVLIECMANTRDHASLLGKEQEAWWVSALYDPDEKSVKFAFLDNGVGVFKSIKWQNFLSRIASAITFSNQAALLRDLLDARLGSRTGLTYRGKGLPAIKLAQARGQISKLRLITNEALLDATSGQGSMLSTEFRGTCLTWEIRGE